MPGVVLDLDTMPEGAVLDPGLRVRHRGREATIATEGCPRCGDDVIVLVHDDGNEECLCCGALTPGAHGVTIHPSEHQ